VRRAREAPLPDVDAFVARSRRVGLRGGNVVARRAGLIPVGGRGRAARGRCVCSSAMRRGSCRR
jgi:hypothetical protein